MSDPHAVIRMATPEDEAAVCELAADMATSFDVDPVRFRRNFRKTITPEGVFVLVADVDGRVGGYLLGFTHPTFFANGPVAWVEEIAVAAHQRRTGIGRQLMADFERRAAAAGAPLIALATRRAADFYRALGYEPSATYFRKFL